MSSCPHHNNNHCCQCENIQMPLLFGTAHSSGTTLTTYYIEHCSKCCREVLLARGYKYLSMQGSAAVCNYCANLESLRPITTKTEVIGILLRVEDAAVVYNSV